MFLKFILCSFSSLILPPIPKMRGKNEKEERERSK
jgi:hypothetical protein